MIRMSTAQVFQNGINQILQRQSQVHASELEISRGKRVVVPSDDPIAAEQIVRLNTELTQIDQYADNADLAMTHLSIEENAIDSIQNGLQRFRELVLQANNSTQSFQERRAIRTELEQISDQVLTTANTKGATGEYIFSGFQSDSSPFQITSGSTVYQGDSGQRTIRIGSLSDVAVGDSGERVFMAISSGNGDFAFAADSANTGTAAIGSTSASNGFVADSYRIDFTQALPDDPITYEVFDGGGASVATGTYTQGQSISFSGATLGFDGIPADGDRFHIEASTPQDVFTSLRQVTDALGSLGDEGAERARLRTELAAGLENIDQVMEHLSQVRTEIGSRMGRIETQLDLNADFQLRVQESLSNLQDLDITQAISQLNLDITTLEAAQQAYLRVQGLSLFNYL